MNRTLVKKWIQDNKPSGDSKLALAAGISLSTLHKTITDVGYNPTVKTVSGLAKAMGISMGELFSHAEEEATADDGPPAA